jgi:hypothetical protein
MSSAFSRPTDRRYPVFAAREGSASDGFDRIQRFYRVQVSPLVAAFAVARQWIARGD